jgi:hypothetical protein
MFGKHNVERTNSLTGWQMRRLQSKEIQQYFRLLCKDWRKQNGIVAKLNVYRTTQDNRVCTN